MNKELTVIPFSDERCIPSFTLLNGLGIFIRSNRLPKRLNVLLGIHLGAGFGSLVLVRGSLVIVIGFLRRVFWSDPSLSPCDSWSRLTGHSLSSWIACASQTEGPRL